MDLKSLLKKSVAKYKGIYVTKLNWIQGIAGKALGWGGSRPGLGVTVLRIEYT